MTLLTFLLRAQLPVPVPVITFPAPPPLIVIEPGVQVVEELYWVRRDGRGFKSKTTTATGSSSRSASCPRRW